MILHRRTGMSQRHFLKRVRTTELDSLQKQFEIHHVVDNHRECIFRIIPGPCTSHLRIETGCKRIRSIHDNSLARLVSCQTKAVTIAAHDLETYVMVICTETKRFQTRLILQCQFLELRIIGIFIYQP